MSWHSRSRRIDSWLRGILISFAGVVLGVLLVAAMVGLLFSNDLQFAKGLSRPDLIVWVIRAAGTAGLMLGFALVASPFSAMANIIPGFAEMLRFGTLFIAAAAGIGVGALTIALVWLFHAPWIALAIFLCGAAIAVAILYAGMRLGDARYPSTPLAAASVESSDQE